METHTFERDGFRLELEEAGRADAYGKVILGYALHDDQSNGPDEPAIFTGFDFHVSPLHAWDSDAAIGGLLGFLSLKPGDTDAEYFDGYTDRQRAFCESPRCDDLALIADDLKNGE